MPNYETIQDTVVVQFNVEEAIKSDTVKVSTRVVLSVAADEATDVRQTILDALKAALDTEWAFTSLDRGTDASGREQISAGTVARIPEAQVAGFARKCQSASREGLQITPGQIDYNPARSLVEKAKVNLRKEIYKLAQGEAALLNDLAGKNADGKWRVGDIQFNDVAPMMANNIRAGKMAMLESTSYSATSAAPGGGGGLDLTQKVGLTASVALQRVVVKAATKDK